MVFCIVAMVVFGFLGIFSAKYRAYAKEAFRCAVRLATLRPCNTQFDELMKAKITARLTTRSPRIGKAVYIHFSKISIIFAIVMIVSLGYTAYSVFNLITVGTCDPSNPGQCIFNPSDLNSVTCPFEGLEPASGVSTIGGFMSIKSANVSGVNDKPLVYFFGTTWCPHCNWERPIFLNVTGKFGKWSSIYESDFGPISYTSEYLVVKAFEIDMVQPSESDMKVFQHYSPDGIIPVIVLGGKYFRIGSGETQGKAAETLALTAILCNITGSPAAVADCADSAVQEMAGRL